MKKNLIILFLLIFTSTIFAQSQKIKFIKGNIAEKTAAVREATNEDVDWLVNKAISFVLENKELLENDRELEGLAVAAIMSISPESVNKLSEDEKNLLTENLISLFNKFYTSNTVQISLLSKILLLKNDLPTAPFTQLLNDYITNLNADKVDFSVLKAVLNTIEIIGTSESFIYVYTLWNNPTFEKLYPEIESTLRILIPNSMNETIAIIQTDEINELTKIFSLIKNNQNISKNSLCEIAENVLNESILIIDNSSIITKELIELQLDSVAILNENKWTRAGKLIITYFKVAQKEYEASLISESNFTKVIETLINLAPIYSITPLTGYLEELNNQKENSIEVSDTVVLSVINTLGAIGDKSAFDSLLAVTYLNYPENVLSAAREALTGLRW